MREYRLQLQETVFYIVLFFAGIVIQFSWSQFLSFHGLAPNILIAFIMFLGLIRGSMIAQIFGFAWGLSWDVLSIDLFGSHALLFTCMGYFAGYMNRKWNESKVVNQMLLTLVASVFFWVGLYGLHQVFSSGDYRLSVNYIMCIQPVYTMLVAPFIFWAGDRMIELFDIRISEF